MRAAADSQSPRIYSRLTPISSALRKGRHCKSAKAIPLMILPGCGVGDLVPHSRNAGAKLDAGAR
jgi:hypothetical protein